MPTVLSGALIELDITLVLQLAIFLTAFFVLRSLVFNPMLALFSAREASIDGAREEAKRMEREAKEKATSFDDEIRKIRAVSQEERDRLRQEGLRREREILEHVRLETDATLKDAEQKLKLEASQSRTEIRNVVPALAREIASKLLGREVHG
ncbi:MAG: ATP synthase F0 subunit B [Polyangiales bacterium]|nr:ATP synthase F0 subunit B [Myxococcales bacterium]